MKEITIQEAKQVQGGALVTAFLAGAALGALAKKLYNKYKANQASQEAFAQACASNPNCA